MTDFMDALTPIQPQTAEPLSGKLPVIACAGNGAASRFRLVPGVGHDFSRPIPLPTLTRLREARLTLFDRGVTLNDGKMSRMAGRRVWMG